jgi:hypothetical protein
MIMMKRFLGKTTLFLFLLPLFFVFHGFAQNFGLITLRDSLLLLCLYLGAAVILLILSYWVFGNFIKAGLFSFLLLLIYFFFGAVLDFLKQNTIPVFRYSILLPILLVLVIAAALYLKKTTGTFYRLVLFLNFLLVVYLLIDLTSIGWKSLHPDPDQLSVYHLSTSHKFSSCDDCPNPDIYFLLFDEYSSSINLSRAFNYDNSNLDSFLAQKGFSQQIHSSSNYNFTPFSVASILNMNYINGIKDINACTVEDYARCNNLIRNNEVIQFLSSRHYDIVNYSIFDLAGNPSPVEQSLLPVKTRLITAQTLSGRFMHDIGWHFYTGRLEIKWLTKNRLFGDLHHNNLLMERVKNETRTVGNRPRFIYGHFVMPHPPFYFDKYNQPRSAADLIKEATGSHIESYAGYIPYTNSKIKELIDTIQQNTKGSAVIILMGDHGYRANIPGLPESHFFQNMNAVYIPDKNYGLFKDSISGVNQFRVILNTLFKQSIPLIRDTTIFLKDKE